MSALALEQNHLSPQQAPRAVGVAARHASSRRRRRSRRSSPSSTACPGRSAPGRWREPRQIARLELLAAEPAQHARRRVGHRHGAEEAELRLREEIGQRVLDDVRHAARPAEHARRGATSRRARSGRRPAAPSRGRRGGRRPRPRAGRARRGRAARAGSGPPRPRARPARRPRPRPWRPGAGAPGRRSPGPSPTRRAARGSVGEEEVGAARGRHGVLRRRRHRLTGR